MPVVIDDLLVQFDDDRAGAALRVLAGLATKTQVFFFTHHTHLLDIAARVLTPGVLAVHHLAGPPSLSVTSRPDKVGP